MSDTDSAPGNTSSVDSHIVTANSLMYWEGISADVNGMLGGYPQVSRIDLQGSKNFIAKVRRLNAKPISNDTTSSTSTDDATTTSSSTQNPSKPTHKLPLTADCGAGIGRITLGLLTHISETVDIVEPITKFANVLADHPLHTSGAIGTIYTTGLESWSPTKKYDLIWNQWCLGHLTDAQLTAYLGRAGRSLTDDGWIGVKENLSTEKFGEDVFDATDSSVTRSDASWRRVFEEAGMEVVKAELQTGFPRGLGLFPVKMYALRPR